MTASRATADAPNSLAPWMWPNTLKTPPRLLGCWLLAPPCDYSIPLALAHSEAQRRRATLFDAMGESRPGDALGVATCWMRWMPLFPHTRPWPFCGTLHDRIS